MPFQAGNKLGGRKEKPFRDALRLQLAAAGENHKKLRLIADALIEKAQEGDTRAICELADRLDGKVPHGLIGGDDDDNPIRLEKIERVIVKPDT